MTIARTKPCTKASHQVFGRSTVQRSFTFQKQENELDPIGVVDQHSSRFQPFTRLTSHSDCSLARLRRSLHLLFAFALAELIVMLSSRRCDRWSCVILA
jgi:hypothetical protein